MLKWLTVISVILTLIVGVLSALFKAVREHETPHSADSKGGETAKSKLPILTGWGWSLLVVLFMLCATSIVLVFISSKQAEDNDRKAEVTQQDLTNKLSQLSRDNEELRKGNALLYAGNTDLRKRADLNFDKLVQSQQEAANRHIQSLDRFSALITREETIGRNTAPTVDRLSFVLTLPGDQRVASAFLTRIKDHLSSPGQPTLRRRGAKVRLIEGAEPILLDPESAFFPSPNDDTERELYTFLTFVRVNVYFFREPVEVQFPTPRVRGFYRFSDAPSFRAVVDAPIIPGRITGFGEKYADGQIVATRYDEIKNLILFEGDGLRNLYTGLTTWDDLANYYVVISLDTHTAKPKVNVSSLTLLSSAGTYLFVHDFKPFYQDELSYLFLARIPPDAKWQ